MHVTASGSRLGTSKGIRLGLVAAATLMLVSGVACSADNAGGPTQSPTGGANPGPSTGAPGPTTPTSTLPPPATTPVPPPTPGNVNSTVPAKPEQSKKPVHLDKPSDTGTGLTARIASVEPVNAKARLPGEVAGPALAITLTVTNSGTTSAPLDSVVVTLADSGNAPGNEMSAKPAKPFPAKVAPGNKATAVYVFTVPKNKRNPITVTATLGDAPVLVFTGNAG
jgi:hypothetical protein